jgi:hypothetical protein
VQGTAPATNTQATAPATNTQATAPVSAQPEKKKEKFCMLFLIN